MEKLSQQTGETVNLAVPDGGDVLNVAEVPSTYILTSSGGWIGRRTRPHAVANGKVLLAYGAIPVPRRLERYTDADDHQPQALDEELAAVRRERLRHGRRRARGGTGRRRRAGVRRDRSLRRGAVRLRARVPDAARDAGRARAALRQCVNGTGKEGSPCGSTCCTSAAPGAPAAAGTAPAISPSSGEAFASVAVGDPGDVDAAVRGRARGLAGLGGAVGLRAGAWCCERSAAAIRRRRDDLARALTQDQGKPLVAEAYDEVDELAEYFRMAGEDAKRLAGELPAVGIGRPPDAVRPGAARRGRRDQPVELAVHDGRGGVRARAGGRATPSSGCPPRPPPPAARCWPRSSRTRACPAGVFNFVPGPGPVVGDALAGHPGVAGVGFVGSVGDRRERSPRGRRARRSCWNWAATGRW